MLKWAAILICTVGCSSTIHYRSQGEIPVHFTGIQGHHKAFTHNARLEFYFWGKYPDYHAVYLDQVGKEAGFTSISRIKIKEYQSLQDVLMSYLTLGLYTPRSFVVSGFGSRRFDNVEGQ